MVCVTDAAVMISSRPGIPHLTAMMNLRENEPERDDSPLSEGQSPYDLPDRNPDYEDRSNSDRIYERKEQDNRTREQ